MATLSLKISISDKNVVKTMQFEPSLMVYDACRLIKDKITEANVGQRKESPLYLIFELQLTVNVLQPKTMASS